MRFAYADPPYLGMSRKFYSDHPEHAVYDSEDGHRALIGRLCDEFPDGWAMSLSSTTLRAILPMCPDDCRVLAWVKPFCSFKPNVRVAYAWEPIILRGGRKMTRYQATVRDWFAESITLRRGFTGAKPAAVIFWLLEVLGADRDDEIVDLFPGSGAVGRAIEDWRRTASLFDASAIRATQEALL